MFKVRRGDGDRAFTPLPLPSPSGRQMVREARKKVNPLDAVT